MAGAPAPDQLAEQRRRWAAIQAHPVVKALLSRYSADVIQKEFVPRDEWLARFPG